MPYLLGGAELQDQGLAYRNPSKQSQKIGGSYRDLSGAAGSVCIVFCDPASSCARPEVPAPPNDSTIVSYRLALFYNLSKHMAIDRQTPALPPAQPSFILRGHTAPIHSVQFIHRNTRLLTGDAEGWVIYWKVETKRPVAVWKAHESAILGTENWGHERIIT